MRNTNRGRWPGTPTARTRRGREEATRSKFEDFLLAEYEHVAQAHFNTVVAISQFFQYYLIIAGVPISAAVIFGDSANRLQFVRDHPSVVAVALTILAAVGLSVMGYLVNLRHDALLYARTVNGIRKRFLETARVPIEEELRFRVLPRTTHLPRYAEPRYFGFVVLAFALIDTAYAAGGWWAVAASTNAAVWYWVAGGMGVASFALHVAVYWGLARHREFSYLRAHIIGVDIDGVIAKHREQFCEVLQAVIGKSVDPQRITRIPVHECEGLGVSEQDELAVFHTPRYWTGMPTYEDAADIIRRLQNILQYRVWVFSWRGWPDWGRVPDADLRGCIGAWADALPPTPYAWPPFVRRWYRPRVVRPLGIVAVRRFVGRWPRADRWCRMWLDGWLDTRAIHRITAAWLREVGIQPDRLVIEWGNVDSPDPRGRVRNRFVEARQAEVRIFVEDDLGKAVRLAGICEVVFLLDQPYNQADGRELPTNLIRARSWKEIHRFIREHL